MGAIEAAEADMESPDHGITHYISDTIDIPSAHSMGANGIAVVVRTSA